MGEVAEGGTLMNCPSARRRRHCRTAWSKEHLACLLATLLVTDEEALSVTVAVPGTGLRCC